MKWTGHNMKCIFSQLKNKISINPYYCTSFLQPHQYSEEEQKKILETLQLCAEENLSRYHLTEKKLLNIKQFLKTHGKFTNLDEIFTIDGMGPQSSSLIFKSILNNDNPLAGTKLKRVTGLLTPSFDKIKHKVIYRCIVRNHKTYKKSYSLSYGHFCRKVHHLQR
uniref:Uncharacterized protein n=1 Tax=Clastoptera arizonana TaxID=38151 RepID=A0A1B6D7S2_9HEMI